MVMKAPPVNAAQFPSWAGIDVALMFNKASPSWQHSTDSPSRLPKCCRFIPAGTPRAAALSAATLKCASLPFKEHKRIMGDSLRAGKTFTQPPNDFYNWSVTEMTNWRRMCSHGSPHPTLPISLPPSFSVSLSVCGKQGLN